MDDECEVLNSDKTSSIVQNLEEDDPLVAEVTNFEFDRCVFLFDQFSSGRYLFDSSFC